MKIVLTYQLATLNILVYEGTITFPMNSHRFADVLLWCIQFIPSVLALEIFLKRLSLEPKARVVMVFAGGPSSFDI